MYDSGGFRVYDENGNKERIPIEDYSLDKFRECLDCRHFRTACEDYHCIKNGGKDCLLQKINLFEKK